MRHFLTVIISVLLAFSSSAVVSESDTAIDPAVAAAIVAKLKIARDDLDYRVVATGPVPGFYQVQVQSGPVLYVSEDGEYFFDGTLYQVRPGQFVNMRDLELSKKRREVFVNRRTDDMIIFRPEGETKAIMNVFTDVDCGYCRKLHAEVPQLNAMGIEVRYLAYPRTGIGSSSYNKLVTAWCSDDQKAALTALKSGTSLSNKTCPNNPVRSHFDLGVELGVTGTPAVVLMDGMLIPGYQPAAGFAKIFGLSPHGG